MQTTWAFTSTTIKNLHFLGRSMIEPSKEFPSVCVCAKTDSIGQRKVVPSAYRVLKQGSYSGRLLSTIEVSQASPKRHVYKIFD